MGVATEHEIVCRLVECFRLAAEECEALAVLPARGPTYKKLRENLKLIEGCCRSLSAYREDTRWLPVGMMMAEAHRRAGDWLRKYPRTTELNYAHPLFNRLAENLRAGLKAAQDLRDKATGKVGMILPQKMVAVKSGLILPAGYA